MRNKHKVTNPALSQGLFIKSGVNDASCLETVIFGKNLKLLFENAAFEMYSLIAKPIYGSKRKPMKITVTANNTEDLLMAFLKETLHYYLVRKILLCSFKVMMLTENKVHAKLTGEELGRYRNIINDIKSVRYGDIKIAKTRTGYKTDIIFDLNIVAN